MSLVARADMMDQPPTLLVRRLPAILSRTETEDLLRYFGSQSVYVFPPKGPMVSIITRDHLMNWYYVKNYFLSYAQKNCATATFPTRDAAVQVSLSNISCVTQ